MTSSLTRCDAVDFNGARCDLMAGHAGQHVVLPEPPAAPSQAPLPPAGRNGMTWTNERCGAITWGHPCVLPAGHGGDHAAAAPGSTTPASVSPPDVAAARAAAAQMGYVAAGAGVGIAIGSVLPWVTAATGLGSLSVAGTEGDGIVTLGAGLLLALLAFPFGGFQGRRPLAALVALGLAVFAVMELRTVLARMEDATTETVRASVGVGLWIVAAAAVVGVIAMAVSLRQRMAG